MNYSRDHWQAIRAFYALHHDAIMQSASEWGCDPYSWEVYAGVRFTPIESALWSDIRTANLVMYPQYPVGRFFVDFGNPVAKVAIECDGAAYHVNQAKDAARDAQLRELGWSVWRITGRDCITESLETEDEEGRPKIELSAASNLIRSVAEAFPSIRLGSSRPDGDLHLWGRAP